MKCHSKLTNQMKNSKGSFSLPGRIKKVQFMICKWLSPATRLSAKVSSPPPFHTSRARKKQNHSRAGLMLHSPFWWGVCGFSLSQYISATSAECLTHTASAPSIPQQARETDPRAVQPASGKHCSRESQLEKNKIKEQRQQNSWSFDSNP